MITMETAIRAIFPLKKSYVLYPRRLKANIFKANIRNIAFKWDKSIPRTEITCSLVCLVSKIIFANSSKTTLLSWRIKKTCKYSMDIFYIDFFGISKIRYSFTSFPLLSDKFKVHPKWGGKIPLLPNHARTSWSTQALWDALQGSMNFETLDQKLDTSLGNKILFLSLLLPAFLFFMLAKDKMHTGHLMTHRHQRTLLLAKDKMHTGHSMTHRHQRTSLKLSYFYRLHTLSFYEMVILQNE